MKISGFRVGQEAVEYEKDRKDDTGRRSVKMTVRKVYKNHLYASYNGNACSLSREWKKFIVKDPRDAHLTSEDGKSILVPTEEEATDYIELEMLRRWLTKAVSNRNIKKHSLKKLREVKKILEG